MRANRCSRGRISQVLSGSTPPINSSAALASTSLRPAFWWRVANNRAAPLINRISSNADGCRQNHMSFEM